MQKEYRKENTVSSVSELFLWLQSSWYLLTLRVPFVCIAPLQFAVSRCLCLSFLFMLIFRLKHPFHWTVPLGKTCNCHCLTLHIGNNFLHHWITLGISWLVITLFMGLSMWLAGINLKSPSSIRVSNGRKYTPYKWSNLYDFCIS